MEMNALRNIRILRIDPKDTGYGGTAGDGRERPDEEDTERNDVKPHGKSVLKELEKYGTDLTAAAAAGGVDPVIGRETEIDRLIQILGRRKKNNPILIGEAGVGKSAIVEGLALRIV